MTFTVIGGTGFIGSAIVARLRAVGHDVFVPQRDDPSLLTQRLGHVIYAAGVTADFRKRPFDTLRAHVGLLGSLLEKAQFSSLLYLSSARVYRHTQSAEEDVAIPLRSAELEDFYDLTKLTGEGLCHAAGREKVQVVRLSNVIGQDFSSGNFVFDLIRSACATGHITLRSTLDSAKDYILVDDAVRVLIEIMLNGEHTCYNLAAGNNTRHAELLAAIQGVTGATLEIVENAPCIAGPPINIERIKIEFGFAAQDVLSKIPRLIHDYRKMHHAQN